MPKLQEKPSALKRELPALQNLKILYIFLFLWVIFALLDPDPDPQFECGSGSKTLRYSKSQINFKYQYKNVFTRKALKFTKKSTSLHFINIQNKITSFYFQAKPVPVLTGTHTNGRHTLIRNCCTKSRVWTNAKDKIEQKRYDSNKAVFRIRDIFRRISGSLDPYTGLRIRIWMQIWKQLFSSVTVLSRCQQKIRFFLKFKKKYFCLFFYCRDTGTYIYQVIKKSQTVEIRVIIKLYAC
jgi:hypothetical protein